MSRSRYGVYLAFWGALFFTLALKLLEAETRGGITDSAGALRHLWAMAAVLLVLAWVVYQRARDAGLAWWMALLAVPASTMLFPFVLIALGMVRSSETGLVSKRVNAWLVLPALAAGVTVGVLASLMLR